MKMKRYVACLLAGAMLCGLTACSGKTESSVAETEPATEAEETTEVQAVEVTEAETVVFENPLRFATSIMDTAILSPLSLLIFGTFRIHFYYSI